MNIARNKKKKPDKILMLSKSKLNNIETLISQGFCLKGNSITLKH